MIPVIVTNAGNLSARTRARSRLYAEQIVQAQIDNAKLVETKAKQFSQTRYFSLPQLRRMGHPYAKRAPAPPVRPHVINRQSGKFYQSFKRAVIRNADGVYTSVYNTAPWARYLQAAGTKKMIGRPVMEEALARTKAQRDRNLANARRRGYRERTGR